MKVGGLSFSAVKLEALLYPFDFFWPFLEGF